MMSLDIQTLIVAFIGGAGTAVITGILTRKSAREANATSGWSALADAHRAEINLLREDIDKLRSRQDDLEVAIADERKERRTLTGLLRLAIGHIIQLGNQIRSLGGHPGPPPPELTTWMHEDGIVVDQVKATYTRTTVTDTRTPDEDPLEVEHIELHPLDDESED